MKVELKFEREALTSGKQNTICAVIVISNNGNITIPQTRYPINVAIALDRSGSMLKEYKLEQARHAVVYLLERLTEVDIFSLVTFGNKPEIIVESVPPIDKIAIKRKLSSIRASGSTALYDGWKFACGEVEKNIYKNFINRVIVITDGLANRGETHPKRICDSVSKQAKLGISTSTIGLGSDFCEDLLQKMALKGDGNYWYIENPKFLKDIFEGELNGISSTTARRLSLKIETKNPNVKIDVLNDLPIEDNYVKLGDIQLNSIIKVAVQFIFPPSGEDLFEKITLLLKYFSVIENKVKNEIFEFQIPKIPVLDARSLRLNPEVIKDIQIFKSARAEKEAIMYNDLGKKDLALKTIISSYEQLSKVLEQLPEECTPEITKELNRKKFLETTISSTGISKTLRKQITYARYLTSTQKKGGTIEDTLNKINFLKELETNT